MRDERVFDALTAHREHGGFRGAFPHQTAGFRQRRLVEDIEREDAGPGVAGADDGLGALAGFERAPVDHGLCEFGLPVEVAAEIGFVHRCRRVAGHDRMPVEPVNLAVERGEKRAEHLVAADFRRADDQRRPACAGGAEPDLGRPADRAESGRGIEGRAGLVVEEWRAERLQRRKIARQLCVHPRRGLGARDPCDPEGADVLQFRQECRRGHIEEHRGRHARKREDFHHRRGAGEIIAIEGQEWLLHGLQPA